MTDHDTSDTSDYGPRPKRLGVHEAIMYAVIGLGMIGWAVSGRGYGGGWTSAIVLIVLGVLLMFPIVFIVVTRRKVPMPFSRGR